jgi:hypothetical protein
VINEDTAGVFHQPVFDVAFSVKRAACFRVIMGGRSMMTFIHRIYHVGGIAHLHAWTHISSYHDLRSPADTPLTMNGNRLLGLEATLQHGVCIQPQFDGWGTGYCIA